MGWIPPESLSTWGVSYFAQEHLQHSNNNESKFYEAILEVIRYDFTLLSCHDLNYGGKIQKSNNRADGFPYNRKILNIEGSPTSIFKIQYWIFNISCRKMERSLTFANTSPAALSSALSL